MVVAGLGVVAFQPNIIVNNNTPSQVQTTTKPDGTIIMDVLDGHIGQTAVKASSGRGALSGMVDPRVAAQRRVG